MARGLTFPLRPTFSLVNIIILLFVVSLPRIVWACKYEAECNEISRTIPKNVSSVTDEQLPRVCANVGLLNKCLNKGYNDSKCKFDFGFRQLGHDAKNYRKKCQSITIDPEATIPTISATVSTASTVDKTCSRFESNNQYKTCAVFGSWHLRTFDDKLASCGNFNYPTQAVTWPIINNEYFAVQGSFHAVDKSSALRMTTISVIIKQNDCSDYRIYKASIDNLSDVFNNGSPKAKGIRVDVVKEKMKSKIIMKRINSSITINQIGPFLTMTITIPSALNYEAVDSVEMPMLCQHGCPNVNYVKDTNVSLQSTNFPILNNSNAYEVCSGFNFTNYYVHTCAVDFIATNNKTAPLWTRYAMYDYYDSSGGPTSNEALIRFVTPPSTTESNSALGLSTSIVTILFGFLLYMVLTLS